ncbi:glycosyltransferase family 9 protein [Pantoea sp. X85]|uniref:glycosyltransferase family 9 protein n=1 Tax=Pantoea sp. X85 TaxID=3037258 RepID=UPI0024137655|nr:glycosyltransferase family 9 protein [Pantoea sp. X85]WFL69774.1 glycosyltransferase family 9 protein [Pantoea sp. X85]
MRFLKTINRNKNNLLRKIKKTVLLCLIRTIRTRDAFEPVKARNILILRLDDKIGDMVVTTGTAFKLAEKGYRVSVLTGPVCGQLLHNCDYFDQIIQYKNRMSLDLLHAQKFDVVIDFDDVQDYERLKLAWLMRRSHHVGFNKNLPGIYNASIPYLDAEKHITERHKRVLALFDIHETSFHYQLGRCVKEQNRVKNALRITDSDIVVSVNPFSGATDKDFSEEQVISLIYFIHSINPEIKVVVIGQSNKVRSFSAHGALIMSESTINTAVEIVRISDAVVSTDTSIVHIANALNRPLVALYNKRKLKDTGLIGYKTWAPNYPQGNQIVVENDYISHCSINTIFPAVETAIRAASMLKLP